MIYVIFKRDESYACEIVEDKLPNNMVRVRIIGGGIVRVYRSQVKGI